MTREHKKPQHGETFQVGSMRLSEEAILEFNASWWVPNVLSEHVQFRRLSDTSKILILGPGVTCEEVLSVRLICDFLRIKPSIYAVGDEQPSPIGQEILRSASVKFDRLNYGTHVNTIVKRMKGFPSAVICRNPPVHVQEGDMNNPFYYPETFGYLLDWMVRSSKANVQFLLTADHPHTTKAFALQLQIRGISFSLSQNNWYLKAPDGIDIQSLIDSNAIIQRRIKEQRLPDQHVLSISPTR